MPDRKSSARDDIHYQVLRILEQNPHCAQRELAERLGISLGRVNYCLRALVDKGLVKVENFKASENKWGYIYVLTPEGIARRAALTGRFLKRKLAEFEALKAEIKAIAAENPEAASQLGLTPSPPQPEQRP